jgi:hypothetical protein
MPGQVTFVESMTGFVHPCPSPPPPPPTLRDDPERFDTAVHHAASAPSRVTAGPGSALTLSDLTLRVRTEPGPDDGLDGDVLSGLVRWAGREYRITGGEFVALATASTGGRRLRYRLRAEADTGDRILLAGVKIVTGRPWHWWRDTTRMFTLIVTTNDHQPDLAAAGQLQLPARAFARQLGTFHGGLGPITAFLWRFGQRLIRSSSHRQVSPTHSR